jgi:hypothetical protein
MNKRSRYVLLKDGTRTDIEFATKLEAALWERDKTSDGKLDWSVNFTFKIKGDSILYKIVDIKTGEEPRFDWRNM